MHYKRRYAWVVLLFIMFSIPQTVYGHANSSEYRLLAIPMDFLHLAGASIWIGGVVSIVYLWKMDAANDEKDYWTLIQRFAPWAMGQLLFLYSPALSTQRYIYLVSMYYFIIDMGKYS